MLPPQNTNLPPNERRLLSYYRKLAEADQQTLLRFAEFLNGQEAVPPSTVSVPAEPEDIPRPRDETVIAAIKRLRQTYPMINRDTVFHETSALMTQHVMQGREAEEVIDELESLFLKQYQQMREAK